MVLFVITSVVNSQLSSQHSPNGIQTRPAGPLYKLCCVLSLLCEDHFNFWVNLMHDINPLLSANKEYWKHLKATIKSSFLVLFYDISDMINTCLPDVGQDKPEWPRRQQVTNILPLSLSVMISTLFEHYLVPYQDSFMNTFLKSR